MALFVYDAVLRLFDIPIELQNDADAAQADASISLLRAPPACPGFTGLDMMLPAPDGVTVH